MWGLVISVWVLVNGNVERHDFVSDVQFRSQVECTQRGVEMAQRFVARIDEAVGVAFLCDEVEGIPA